MTSNPPQDSEYEDPTMQKQRMDSARFLIASVEHSGTVHLGWLSTIGRVLLYCDRNPMLRWLKSLHDSGGHQTISRTRQINRASCVQV